MGDLGRPRTIEDRRFDPGRPTPTYVERTVGDVVNDFGWVFRVLGQLQDRRFSAQRRKLGNVTVWDPYGAVDLVDTDHVVRRHFREIVRVASVTVSPAEVPFEKRLPVTWFAVEPLALRRATGAVSVAVEPVDRHLVLEEDPALVLKRRSPQSDRRRTGNGSRRLTSVSVICSLEYRSGFAEVRFDRTRRSAADGSTLLRGGVISVNSW